MSTGAQDLGERLAESNALIAQEAIRQRDVAESALREIAEAAPDEKDFEIGGKYDYGNDCGNSDDVALKAERAEHLRLAKIARKVLERPFMAGRASVVQPSTVGKWRVGSKMPLNVYDGDRPVCQCHSEQDAKLIVDAVNRAVQPSPVSEPLRKALETIENYDSACECNDHSDPDCCANHPITDTFCAHCIAGKALLASSSVNGPTSLFGEPSANPMRTVEAIESAWKNRQVNFEREVVELQFAEAEWIDACTGLGASQPADAGKETP